MGLLRRLRESQEPSAPEGADGAVARDVEPDRPASRPATNDRVQEGTDEFIRHIENGACHWQQPGPRAVEWPVNGTTGRPYHGYNVLQLAQRGFEDPRWCTFEQAAAKGWRVNKGERGTTIFFWKLYEKETDKLDSGGDPIVRRFPLLCRFKVFNFSQIAGPEPHEARIMGANEAKRLVDPIVEAIGVTVRESAGASHGYEPESDVLHMRPRSTYGDDLHYYSELLNGVLAVAVREASTQRPPEEGEASDRSDVQQALRVEMARSMLSMRSGLPLAPPAPLKDSELLDLLGQDKREVFRAAKDAERIMRYALAFNPEVLPLLEDEHRAQMDAATSAGAPGMVFDANEFDFWPDDLQHERPRP